MTTDGSARPVRRLRLVAAALLVVLTVPRMAQRGMFVDGLFYAAVSRNLAAGQGRLWAPSYSATIYREYFEQPPLGIAIEAAAFRLAGDRPWVERVYSLVMLGVTALLVGLIWRRFFPWRYDWLPLVFWVAPSIVTWAAVNNMLENTQVVFTSAAAYAALRALGAANRPARAGWSAGAGVLVAVALLVKGPVGAFPLAVPLCALWLPPASRRGPVSVAAVMAAAIACVALLLSAFPGPRHAFDGYLRTQLSPVFHHRPAAAVQVVAMLRHLAGGIVARLVVLAGAAWIFRPRSAAPSRPMPWRAAMCCLSIGLAASAPLAISPKIAGQYMVPSVPWFALAAAAFALPAVQRWRGLAARRWSLPALTLAAAALFVAAGAIPVVHGTLEARDTEMIATMDAVGREVPRDTVAGTCGAAREDWGLLAYAQRLLRLSLDPGGRPVNGWFLQPKIPGCAAPPACRPVEPGATAVLLRCDAGG